MTSDLDDSDGQASLTKFGDYVQRSKLMPSHSGFPVYVYYSLLLSQQLGRVVCPVCNLTLK